MGSNYHYEVAFSFSQVVEEMGWVIGIMESGLPGPDSPVLVHNDSKLRSNLRLRLKNPEGLEEEWYTLNFDLTRAEVDKVHAHLLQLGYPLSVIT